MKTLMNQTTAKFGDHFFTFCREVDPTQRLGKVILFQLVWLLWLFPCLEV